MYEFLCENNLCVANFSFEQNVSHTYARNNARSYIDHVFVPLHFHSNVSHCQIVPQTEDKLSAHLPISTTLELPTLQDSQNSEGQTMPEHPRGKWWDPAFVKLYSTAVEKTFIRRKSIDPPKITKETAVNTVNEMCNSLSSMLHSCVDQCFKSLPKRVAYCKKQ